MKYTEFTYAGLQFAAVEHNNEVYLTPSSIAKALKKDKTAPGNWLRRKNKSNKAIEIEVTIGSGAKRKIKAYPFQLMREMVTYWANNGCKQSIALRDAAFDTDWLTVASRALGRDFTEEQQESHRTKIRFDILNHMAKQPYIQKVLAKCDIPGNGTEKNHKVFEILGGYATDDDLCTAERRIMLNLSAMSILNKGIDKALTFKSLVKTEQDKFDYQDHLDELYRELMEWYFAMIQTMEETEVEITSDFHKFVESTIDMTHLDSCLKLIPA